MNDNEIIKTLEECGGVGDCEKCPLNELGGIDKCVSTLTQNALDLINRQMADIETLENNLKFVRDTLTRALDENDQLKKRLDSHCNNCRMQDRRTRDRAEAIKEFAKKLKEQYSQADILCPRRIVSITEKGLDSLVKEMVGEQK